MTFLFPLFLLGLIPVAAVAIWALFRPGRRVTVVGSLELWRKALVSADRSLRRRARRITAGWVLLLAGAVAVVLAGAEPMYYADAPARRVCVALHPSAELAGEKAMGSLRASVGGLLDRLDPADRVELLLPDVLGGSIGWVSVDQARARLAGVPPLPVRAGELSLPPPGAEAQRVYRFAPAGTELAAGPDVTVVEVPTDVPPVVPESAGAAALSDGRVQVVVSLRSGRPSGKTTFRTATLDKAGNLVGTVGVGVLVGVGPAVCEFAAGDAIAIDFSAVDTPFPDPLTAVYFVRRPAAVKKVAMIGPDLPLVRRFVKIAGWLELVADPAKADVVIANVDEPPAGAAAMLINPRRSPSGWRRGGEVRHVRLDAPGVNVADDDVLLRDVDLAGAAVRRVRPWIASDSVHQRRLVTFDGDALVLRTEHAGAESPGLRRLYVAFDLDAANTTLAMSESFVIFLANAMHWLSPGGEGAVRYEYITPLEAGRQPGWTRVPGTPPPAPGDAGPLPWPGVYRDAAGELHAVSLPGLRAGQPEVPHAEAVARAPLPTPARASKPRELWPILVALAIALWIAGWALRLR